MIARLPERRGFQQRTVQGRQVPVRRPPARDHGVDLRGVGGLGDKVAPQLLGDIGAEGGLGEDQVGQVVGVKPPGLAEDRLLAVVVLALPEVELTALVHAVAGQCAGNLADVGLGVAAPLSQREQLQQFAGEVFVRGAFDVLDVAQIEQHRRVTQLQRQHIPERAIEAVADGQELARRQLRVFVIFERSHEVVHPEQGHLLLERAIRADHLHGPPSLQGLQVEELLTQRQLAQRLVLGVEEFDRDRPVVEVLGQGLGFRRPGVVEDAGEQRAARLSDKGAEVGRRRAKAGAGQGVAHVGGAQRLAQVGAACAGLGEGGGQGRPHGRTEGEDRSAGQKPGRVQGFHLSSP